jgi:hypothetical protein
MAVGTLGPLTPTCKNCVPALALSSENSLATSSKLAPSLSFVNASSFFPCFSHCAACQIRRVRCQIARHCLTDQDMANVDALSTPGLRRLFPDSAPATSLLLLLALLRSCALVRALSGRLPLCCHDTRNAVEWRPDLVRSSSGKSQTSALLYARAEWRGCQINNY